MEIWLLRNLQIKIKHNKIEDSKEDPKEKLEGINLNLLNLQKRKLNKKQHLLDSSLEELDLLL